MSDYRNFKTPFYDIEIRDPTGTRKVKLPHHILRLVTKIKLVEALDSSQPNTISIEIIEGSREPASPDPGKGTSGLYMLDNSIGGSITNRTGAITDLRFSGNSGITFFNDEERRLGRIDDRPQKNTRGQIITRTHPNEVKTPIFLFQERNILRITFGYLEDKKTHRTVNGRIVMFATDYPDIGPIKSIITATSTETFLDQVAPSKGFPLSRIIKFGEINSQEDISTSQLLNEICDRLGIAEKDRIISSTFTAPKEEKDKSKLIAAGQSFKNFLDQLALKNNAYWKMVPKKNGKEKFFFMTKKDFEAETILNDPILFTYKSPGSIIKSVNIKADFGGFGADTKVGLTETGQCKANTESTDIPSVLYKSAKDGKQEQLLDLDPTKDINVCRELVTFFDGTFSISERAGTNSSSSTGISWTSHAESLPTQSDEKHDQDIAKADAEDKKRVISLEMVTIGYTQIIPGVLEIKGLGSRYSGKYRIMSVDHTIDNSGYFTRVSAVSFSTSKGGLNHTAADKGKETFERRDLFTPTKAAAEKDAASSAENAKKYRTIFKKG
jgi:hypothetical protein